MIMYWHPKALKRGAVVAHGFGQFYALSTRPDASTVGQMNQWKGRPFDQVGSISTTPLLIPSLFDWSKVPDENARPRVLALMDALLALGPFGFRGPAHEDIPMTPLQQRWRNPNHSSHCPGLSLSKSGPHLSLHPPN